MNALKKLSAVISFILMVSLFGCDGTSSSVVELIDKNEPVTIAVWHYYNGVQQVNFDNSVEEFNNTVGRDKGIIVEAYSKGSISELADSVIASVKKSAGAENPPLKTIPIYICYYYTILFILCQ